MVKAAATKKRRYGVAAAYLSIILIVELPILQSTLCYQRRHGGVARNVNNISAILAAYQ